MRGAAAHRPRHSDEVGWAPHVSAHGPRQSQKGWHWKRLRVPKGATSFRRFQTLNQPLLDK
eukprot:6546824-Prymnesium_polylepis.2